MRDLAEFWAAAMKKLGALEQVEDVPGIQERMSRRTGSPRVNKWNSEPPSKFYTSLSPGKWPSGW